MLIALVCFAFLDHIPDPPTVLHKQTSADAKSCHIEPVKELVRVCFYVGTIWAPVRFSALSLSKGGLASKFHSPTLWRTAGDSSPPATFLGL
jgi:hypothetical protein